MRNTLFAFLVLIFVCAALVSDASSQAAPVLDRLSPSTVSTNDRMWLYGNFSSISVGNAQVDILDKDGRMIKSVWPTHNQDGSLSINFWDNLSEKLTSGLYGIQVHSEFGTSTILYISYQKNDFVPHISSVDWINSEEISVKGSRLGDPQRLLFYDKKLMFAEEQLVNSIALNKELASESEVHVKVTGQIPLPHDYNAYSVRIVTQQGTSSMATFWPGEVPTGILPLDTKDKVVVSVFGFYARMLLALPLLGLLVWVLRKYKSK